MKHVVALCMMSFLLLSNAKTTLAQSNQQIQKYIERYRNLAMSEQQRTGIPAAIKLAQGIHETGAGTSALAINANNHFGLKCKRGWTGQTYMHSDNRPNECFRKYAIDFESYQDHSDYLKSNPRYAALFQLSVTDYAAWAMELRKAGYATNPQYAQKLIKLIETYRLQQYTYLAMDSKEYKVSTPATAGNAAQDTRSNKFWGRGKQEPEPVATTEPQQSAGYGSSSSSSYSYRNRGGGAATATTPATTTPPQQNGGYSRGSSSSYSYNNRGQDAQPQRAVQNRPVANKVVKLNNLKAVYGKKGEMPLQYAVNNNVRYQKFLEMNDLDDAPLPADMPLYLERKHFWGIRPMHLVKPYETMLVIAQKEGIQLKYLRDLNYMEEGEEPMPGVTLELQAQAAEKPRLLEEMKKPVVTKKKMVKNPMQPTPDTGPFGWNLNKKEEEEPVKPTASTSRSYRQQPSYTKTQPARNNNSNSISDRIINDANNASAQSYGVNDDATYGSNDDYENETQQAYNNPRYVDPNANQQVVNNTPAAAPAKTAKELRQEAKEAKRLAKLREKEEAERKAAVSKQYGGRPQQTMPQQPVQQEPKSELDQLKAQFDDVIYSQSNTQQQQAYSQPAQRQPQRDPSKYYTVQDGDTAYTIAKKHGITVRQLMDWNGLDFDAIKAGQSLRIKQ